MKVSACPAKVGGEFEAPELWSVNPQAWTDLEVASTDSSLVLIVELKRLLKDKEMLGSIVPGQRVGDDFSRGFAAPVPVLRKVMRVVVPRDDRTDNLHARLTGDVANNIVKLNVHEGKSLLHVLNVDSSQLDELCSMSKVCSKRCDLLRWPETTA